MDVPVSSAGRVLAKPWTFPSTILKQHICTNPFPTSPISAVCYSVDSRCSGCGRPGIYRNEWFSSITHTYPDLPEFFLIVYHPGGFPSTQHKAVCRLHLTAVCERPVLSLMLAIPCSVRSASVFVLSSLKVFHLLHSTHFPVEEMIQDTHVFGLGEGGVFHLKCWCGEPNFD